MCVVGSHETVKEKERHGSSDPTMLTLGKTAGAEWEKGSSELRGRKLMAEPVRGLPG